MSGKQPRENSDIRERPGKKVANFRNLNLENTDVNADTYAPAGDDVNHNLSGTRVSKNFACKYVCQKKNLTLRIVMINNLKILSQTLVKLSHS